MANTQYQLAGDAAQRYEQGIIPTTMKPLAQMMFEHVTLQKGDRVLDIACGTGIVARVILEKMGNVGRIVGVDLNPSMLEVARATTPTTDIPITWQQADACALPFLNDSFDIVICQHGLQFIPNKLAVLNEMCRVLGPGGRLAFTVWGAPSSYNASLAEALAHHVSEATASSVLAPFALRDTDTIRTLLQEGGFHNIEIQTLVLMRRFPSSALTFASMQPYGPDVAKVHESVRTAIEQEVKAAIQAYDEVSGFVVMPQGSHLVQAQVA